MEKYPARTFENFYNAVRQDFIEFNKRLSEQEIDRFLFQRDWEQSMPKNGHLHVSIQFIMLP